MGAQRDTARRLDALGITAVYAADKIDGGDVMVIDMEQAKILLDVVDAAIADIEVAVDGRRYRDGLWYVP